MVARDVKQCSANLPFTTLLLPVRFRGHAQPPQVFPSPAGIDKKVVAEPGSARLKEVTSSVGYGKASHRF